MSQPSQSPDTSHVSDIRRPGRDAARRTSGRVTGFEPTASSSRTRVQRDDQYQRVPARPNLATALNNLGNRLDAVGRREEALAATEEAVDHYRALAQANPAAYLPNLTTTLNNLGVRLNAVGRREEAKIAWAEAVGLNVGIE